MIKVRLGDICPKDNEKIGFPSMREKEKSCAICGHVQTMPASWAHTGIHAACGYTSESFEAKLEKAEKKIEYLEDRFKDYVVIDWKKKTMTNMDRDQLLRSLKKIPSGVEFLKPGDVGVYEHPECDFAIIRGEIVMPEQSTIYGLCEDD